MKLLVFSFIFSFSTLVSGQDTRVCGTPARDEHGVILRSDAVKRAFQAQYPCPSTNKPTGSCPGWAKDHVIPLACGGCDSVENMQWLPHYLKSCKGVCKDRWERKIYCKGN